MRLFALIPVALFACIATAEAAPLSVRIYFPQNGATYKTPGGVGISALASGTTPITRVEFYEGTSLKATDISAPYNIPWRVSPSENGTHLWTARAYDAAGNVSTSAPVVINVDVDAIAPEVIITNSPSIATITVAGTQSIVATASDNVAVTRVEFLDNGQVEHIAASEPYTFMWRINAGDNGAHRLVARAFDAAGNHGDSEPVAVSVDLPAPQRPVLAMACRTLRLTGGQSQTFQVRKAGPGTLRYMVRPEADWLTVSPATGTIAETPSLHTITAAASALRGPTNAVVTLIPTDGSQPETMTIYVEPAAPAAPRAPTGLRVGH